MFNQTNKNMKKCSKCGTKMIADRSQVLTSYPPQYLYRCPSCGNVEYGLCSEDNPFEEDDSDKTVDVSTNWNLIRNLAAMFAMNGLITADVDNVYTENEISEMAISQADSLVKKLKENV